MRYVSTRGGAGAGFAEVLLGGPAADGGLYLPEEWPLLKPAELREFALVPYADAAYRVMRPFVGETFGESEFGDDIDSAYGSFTHPAVAPLTQIGPGRFLLELFHGPTLAFKDVAMQLLGRLFARALKKLGRRATVIVATSGDTGSAAIAALKGQANVDVVVLHPKGLVSDVQRRQMTCVADANVHNIALEGRFDDTQSIVKALFSDAAFAAEVSLTAVNSINFARIMAQSVYYFTASAALGGGYGSATTFVVPTGNFGDIFAGEAAWHMRLPVRKLVVATNVNDILARALASGVYGAGEATATLSPSMDIQVASNFERALFEASGRDANWTESAMAGFSASRNLTIAPNVLENLRMRYAAGAADDAETLATIARVYSESDILVDPHTAVAIAVAAKAELPRDAPIVILSTAHPAKFPDAIEKAIGARPALPPQLADLEGREERCTVLPNSVEAVREFVRAKAGTA